jgi:hypothetical protein
MRIVSAALFLCLLSTISGAKANTFDTGKHRIADNSDACVANCVNQNASCKRACPTTFNTPCLSACDSQLQTCRQSCERK